MAESQERGTDVAAGKKIWVTLTGLPLTVKLSWPFHQSTSGADFWVLHRRHHSGRIGGPACPVAVNLSQTVREVMPSRELKTPKRPSSTRCARKADARDRIPEIGKAASRAVLQPPLRLQTPAVDLMHHVIVQFVERKSLLADETRRRSWIADAAEAQYVQTIPSHLVESGGALSRCPRRLRMEGEWAEPTQA